MQFYIMNQTIGKFFQKEKKIKAKSTNKFVTCLLLSLVCGLFLFDLFVFDTVCSLKMFNGSYLVLLYLIFIVADVDTCCLLAVSKNIIGK